MNNKESLIPNCLLKWYYKAARDLPWRRTKDPYKIWVSEIMLQQTQVDTVIPYYEKWIQRFPTLQHLAKANLSDVLKSWAGLGYYRRARMLHQAACQVTQNLQGKIPQTPLELMKLPGIGRYTAGAVASIAFGMRTPVLDGNVIRVLTRLFVISGDVGKGETLDKLWKITESLVPKKNPGDFNQALMELGATLCMPENPQCQKCPVSSHCKARQKKRETFFPVKLRKEKLEKKRTVALILRDNGTVLIQKQPETGRWGGLWTFPFWKDKKSMLQELEVAAKNLKRRLTLHYGFTRYQIQLDVYEGLRPERSRRTYGNVLRWVKVGELEKFAFPSPHQKIVKELMDHAN